MVSPRHIAVLFHENSLPCDLEGSVVYHFAKFWREAGHRVTFLLGTKRFVPADVLFVHVNLSVVPEEYLEFARRYPAAVNGAARDIRKSAVSGNLVRPETDWRGPVIVKSDLNFGGEPEFLLGSRFLRRSRAGRFLMRLASHGGTPFPSGNDYPIFDRVGLVPRPMADDPRLVIEKFVPEVEDDLYHLRVYQFLGDRATCRRLAAREPLIKAGNAVRTEAIEPHPVVEEWRRRFRLDYGKIDYVVHEGSPILLDANKTTGAVPTSNPQTEERRRFHAGGIESFFRDAPDP